MNALTPGGAATDLTLSQVVDALTNGAAVKAVTRTPYSAAIASGASLSGAIDLGSQSLAKINMPATWTAAAITFSVSADGVTYRDLYDNAGNEYTISAANTVANRSIIVPVVDWLGTRFVKVRSGTSAAPVNQAAARAVELVAA